MSFKTLEQRFNETTSKLYTGAKYKFENGRASTGLNDDPLIVRAPGKGYWNFAEGRSTPLASAALDVKRMTLFTASVRGVRFLAKQQLLQTGNTFESTRIINPVFHISNAVPFIHTKRMIDIPITGRGIARAILGNNALTKRIFGSGEQKKDIASLRKIGQLQEETYNSATQAINVKSLIKKIPVIGQTISAIRAKRSVGDGVKPFEESRPELSKLGLRGAITTLFSRDNTSKSGYVMANQIITNSKLNDKYITNFKPKYFPKLNDSYATYLKFSNGESTWYHSGQGENVYIQSLQLAQLSPFTNRWEPATIFPSNVLTRYIKKPSAKITELIDKNIKITRYVDYGSAERYIGTYYTKLTVPEANKNIEFFAYPALSSSKDFDSKQSTYINNQTIESETDRELPTAMVQTSGQPLTRKPTGEGLSYIKYFTYGEGTIRHASVDDIKEGNSTNAETVALGADGNRRVISYIKDASNETLKVKNSLISREAYSRIQSTFEDPIVVSFAMGMDGHVRFRAYIKDLVQNANPKYNPLQYIGRMEQFIYYTGVQREVSFKLGLVAFSKDELDGLWRRMNYLTGMAYPYGFNKGIFQPNIIRMTIGDVYTDQPGYVTAINTNFSEIVETWELNSGKQVPISATVSMTFTLIEKASRIADSPFYGITEKLDGFSAQIPTAGANADANTTTSPPRNDEPVRDTIQTRNLQGFDELDKSYTTRIMEAYRKGDNQSVQNLGLLQARRREEHRRILLGTTAAVNNIMGGMGN